MRFGNGRRTWATGLAQDTPGPAETAVRLRSGYGPGRFAFLRAPARWRARPVDRARPRPPATAR